MSTLALPLAVSFAPPRLNLRSPLGWAIGASLLMHALALGWLPGLDRAVAYVAPPLRVLLAVPASIPQASELTPVSVAGPSARRSDTPRPVLRESVPVIARPATTSPAGVPSVPAVPSLPIPQAPVAAVEEPSRPVPAPVMRTAVPDPDALNAYGRHLAGAVAGHQRYPRVAQLRGWQGTALVRLDLTADGQLADARVVSSSGHDVLDRQALDMVRAATPLPPVPSSLAGRPLHIDVPVVFRLAS